MEFGTIILLWLIVMLFDNVLKRKKRRVPPPKNNSPDFDIPTLANDPNLPGEEIPIFIDGSQQVEVRPRDYTPRPKKISAPIREQEPSTELDLTLTPSNVMNAIVLAEILDKPKALRHKKFSRR